jgi:hypothetical protein
LAGQLADARAVEVFALVVKRYRHVERVTCHNYVCGTFIERDSVERCVRLDEPAVPLCFEPCTNFR